LKIIDRYILVSYLKTFISVFVILMFIFVLQTIWLYISELAGKDLDLEIIFKFLLYFSPKLIPLVLPLTILVSSIMVFGSFAEKYEFAAMKSTGISLQRAMRSLMVFIFVLSGTAFLFANNVIPFAEYKSLNLRRNIAQLKPAIAVVEGQFSEIGDITIKVAKKEGDRGQYLTDVIIHKKDPRRTGNYTVIKSESGELISKEGSNTLSLKLYDGNYYDEIFQKDPKKVNNRPFAKSYFDEYVINIDLTEFNAVDLDEEQELSNQKMYKISELRYELDSLSRDYNETMVLFSENMAFKSGFTQLNENFKPNTQTDTPATHPFEPFQVYDHQKITELAIANIKTTVMTINAKKVDYLNKKKRLNKYEIALHEKYVIGFSCIILFFVGAPLGAIIRKGGMGLPMVVAIVLFLAYHFIGIFAKNNAENGVMNPLLASWFSTLVMLPLSVWLTHRATTDQGIFDPDGFVRPVVSLFKKVFGKKSEEVEHQT
jgi:lipopolysaccharide export system permease protein